PRALSATVLTMSTRWPNRASDTPTLASAPPPGLPAAGSAAASRGQARSGAATVHRNTRHARTSRLLGSGWGTARRRGAGWWHGRRRSWRGHWPEIVAIGVIVMLARVSAHPRS